jgi:Asp-tRNA(Asn)/Glu-tRNA(Gln) amidotransferase A subunit family amidase
MRARLSCKSVAITQQAELAPADLRGVRIGLPRAYYWETLDADVAKIMDTTLDKLRGAGAVLAVIKAATGRLIDP